MISNAVLTGCDLDEFWWSRREPSCAQTWWPLFSIPVFLSWIIAVMWLKVGKQSRNCDYSQQARHSPHLGPRRDDIVCGSAVFHYWLCEQELSLTCSVKPVLHTKPRVPFRFIDKESNKNWRAEPLLGLLPKDCTAESWSPLCTPSTNRGGKVCFAELLNPFLEGSHCLLGKGAAARRMGR